MGKSIHFFGQPVYGQLIKSLDRDKIVQMSRTQGGERYVKSFDGWHHLLTMLYAVIIRFDSLREIEASMQAEVRKLGHIGLETVPGRSTLLGAIPSRAKRKEVSRFIPSFMPTRAYPATFGLPPLPPTTPSCLLLLSTITERL